MDYRSRASVLLILWLTACAHLQPASVGPVQVLTLRAGVGQTDTEIALKARAEQMGAERCAAQRQHLRVIELRSGAPDTMTFDDDQLAMRALQIERDYGSPMVQLTFRCTT